eukprot:gnl/Chilomastix_cuspidata/661.p1 GENE.gnl/Chilomastix_cuspidata/661~~gnl/Chilomastix_cuspidata/661.p1  ORF type:complete len:1192 (+),score=383.85 gnl/Chilomastix_cuspidata/661:52-3627(+)
MSDKLFKKPTPTFGKPAPRPKLSIRSISSKPSPEQTPDKPVSASKGIKSQFVFASGTKTSVSIPKPEEEKPPTTSAEEFIETEAALPEPKPQTPEPAPAAKEQIEETLVVLPSPAPEEPKQKESPTACPEEEQLTIETKLPASPATSPPRTPSPSSQFSDFPETPVSVRFERFQAKSPSVSDLLVSEKSQSFNELSKDDAEKDSLPYTDPDKFSGKAGYCITVPASPAMTPSVSRSSSPTRSRPGSASHSRPGSRGGSSRPSSRRRGAESTLAEHVEGSTMNECIERAREFLNHTDKTKHLYRPNLFLLMREQMLENNDMGAPKLDVGLNQDILFKLLDAAKTSSRRDKGGRGGHSRKKIARNPNAVKPTILKGGDDPLVELGYQTGAIINKISSKNFKTLQTELISIYLDAKQNLEPKVRRKAFKQLIDQIYAKACLEPDYCGIYANLLHHLFNNGLPLLDYFEDEELYHQIAIDQDKSAAKNAKREPKSPAELREIIQDAKKNSRRPPYFAWARAKAASDSEREIIDKTPWYIPESLRAHFGRVWFMKTINNILQEQFSLMDNPERVMYEPICHSEEFDAETAAYKAELRDIFRLGNINFLVALPAKIITIQRKVLYLETLIHTAVAPNFAAHCLDMKGVPCSAKQRDWLMRVKNGKDLKVIFRIFQKNLKERTPQHFERLEKDVNPYTPHESVEWNYLLIESSVVLAGSFANQYARLPPIGKDRIDQALLPLRRLVDTPGHPARIKWLIETMLVKYKKVAKTAPGNYRPKQASAPAKYVPAGPRPTGSSWMTSQKKGKPKRGGSKHAKDAEKPPVQPQPAISYTPSNIKMLLTEAAEGGLTLSMCTFLNLKQPEDRSTIPESKHWPELMGHLILGVLDLEKAFLQRRFIEGFPQFIRCAKRTSETLYNSIISSVYGAIAAVASERENTIERVERVPFIFAQIFCLQELQIAGFLQKLIKAKGGAPTDSHWKLLATLLKGMAAEIEREGDVPGQIVAALFKKQGVTYPQALKVYPDARAQVNPYTTAVLDEFRRELAEMGLEPAFLPWVVQPWVHEKFEALTGGMSSADDIIMQLESDLGPIREQDEFKEIMLAELFDQNVIDEFEEFAPFVRGIGPARAIQITTSCVRNRGFDEQSVLLLFNQLVTYGIVTMDQLWEWWRPLSAKRFGPGAQFARCAAFVEYMNSYEC